MPPHVTLKQLRYFDALAREQHFGRAADTCAVTQPALSMQIHELEQSSASSLVERTRAGVLLSDKGREIAARAARILSDVRELIDFAQHASGVLSGSLRLGVIPSVAPYMLPPLLPLLRESYPSLELHVRETQTQPLTAGAARRQARRAAAGAAGHASRDRDAAAVRRPLRAGAAESTALSSRVRATKDLIEHERLLAARGRPLPARSGAHLLQSAAGRRVNTFGVSSLSTIVEMVAAGYGITLLPEMCLNVEARGRDIGSRASSSRSRTAPSGSPGARPRRAIADFRALGRLIKVAWSKGCVPPGRKNPRHKRPLTAQSS